MVRLGEGSLMVRIDRRLLQNVDWLLRGHRRWS